MAKIRMKNGYNHLSLEASDWNITPTKFQRSTYPKVWQSSISAIHDGIDTNIARPSKEAYFKTVLPCGITLQKGQQIVTFVNRSLEPYRGCHSFIRSIPWIHKKHPEAKIVIVGKTKGVSYGKPCTNGEYKDLFMAEIEGKYNTSNVIFTGPLKYDSFLDL